ncbi:MAG: hypothetical protein ACK5D5_06015 [Bacteroidota bacterium]|jgi:hypothetical protein
MQIKELVKSGINKQVGFLPCISIILPTHPKGNERQIDEPALRKAIEFVLLQVKQIHPNNFYEIQNKLKIVTEEIDFLRNELGIGVFVSPNFSKWVKFSFPVKEHVIVDSTFRLRELLFQQQLDINYYYLSLNTDIIRLYSFSGSEFKEIRDEAFPHLILDDYIYEKPFRGNSYLNFMKSTEKDKSIMKEKRFQAELKKVDDILQKYLKESPIFISGVKKETGYFLKLSANKKNIAGIIDGNYSEGNNKIPKERIYKEVLSWMNMKEDEMLDALADSFGKRQVASGLEEVWYASKNGMGMDLFIEKDFECEAYLTESKGLLSRFKPLENHQYIPDAVDYIIAIVLSMNGKIHIVGNNKLEQHDRIALKLRYRRSEN